MTSQCDNWWGISLLDVMGKVFTKVIPMRLQKVAEEVLADSQCGFRAGRGCRDMIFFPAAQGEGQRAQHHALSTVH